MEYDVVDGEDLRLVFHIWRLVAAVAPERIVVAVHIDISVVAVRILWRDVAEGQVNREKWCW